MKTPDLIYPNIPWELVSEEGSPFTEWQCEVGPLKLNITSYDGTQYDCYLYTGHGHQHRQFNGPKKMSRAQAWFKLHTQSALQDLLIATRDLTEDAN